MGAYSRRQLRRALSFLVRPLLFAVALTFTVRYLFSSPPPLKITKALVIASTSKDSTGDTSWISSVPKDWEVFNYVTDAPLSVDLAVPINKGNEAMAYLTYIITHYESMPDVVFFHHSHNKAWHQEMDSLAEVRSLRASYVQKAGFASARCLPGCENVIGLPNYSVDFDRFGKLGVGRDAMLTTLLDEFLDKEAGEHVPKKIAAPCCAQFAASREAIHRRPRHWWFRLRQWLQNTPLDSMTSGRLLEHTWHIWLGESAQYCPSYEGCRCHVFGLGECDEYFKKEKSM